jgi:hypothetical protein
MASKFDPTNDKETYEWNQESEFDPTNDKEGYNWNETSKFNQEEN